MATELKHTVKPTGGDYNTLAGAVAHLIAAHANLVGSDNYATIEISGDWTGTPDTAAVTIQGLTVDATRYLRIYTDAANRAGLSWSTAKYQLLVSNATAIYSQDEHVRIDGLQVGKSSSNAHNQGCIYVSTVAAGSAIWISNCLIKQAGNGSYREFGVASDDADATVYMWNTHVYGLGSTNHLLNSAIYATGTWYISSCSTVSGKYGIYFAGGATKTCTVKNTYCGGTLTEDFYMAAGTLAKTNCASEDQSADDTGATETATNCVAAAVLINTDTFVNVTAGSEDFHLAADGNSPLEDAGVDTSGDGAPMNFTTDIDGDTITTWPIGADFRYVAPASGMTNDIVMIFEC